MAAKKPPAYSPQESIAAPTGAFEYTPTDDVDITNDDGEECLVRRVTTWTDGMIHVMYADGSEADIPMINGVPRDMILKRIEETGTTAQIVTDGVICEVS